MKKRVEWVDMAKAVGIIAIVLGHAIHPLTDTSHSMSVLYASLYWWHVPLFFIVGGFFLKPIQRTWASFWAFVRHRIVPNIVLYFVAGIFLILTSHFLNGESWSYTGFYFVRLIYGGQTLNGELSIFWFMTVYVITVFLVVMIISFIKSIPMQFLITMVMFGIGTAQPHYHFFQFKSVPWSADSALIAAVWILTGYYGYKYYPQLKNKVGYAVAGVLIYASCYVKKATIGLNFKLYLKSHIIHTPFMAFFIPIAICLAIFIICEALSRTRFFKWLLPIGQYSLAIMYLHKMIFDVAEKIPLFNHVWAFVILGVVVPVGLAMIYHYFKDRLLPAKRA